MPRQPGFWSVEDRLRELSEQGDPLAKLLEIVDFELFRPVLDAAIGPDDRAKGGRPPFDAVLKLKMLYLMAQHGLSFEQTEHLVRDRLSWMRFCGLSIADPVPDANTLWDFREVLIRAAAFDQLFYQLDRAIKEAGYLPMSGQIVDASLVAAPRQRNTDEEKAAIKAGKTAAEIWPDKPAKAAQKDTDARPPRPAGRVPFRNRMNGLLAIHGPSRPARARSKPTARSNAISRSRPSATSRTSASIDGTASSAGRRPPMPRRTMVPGCAKV